MSAALVLPLEPRRRPLTVDEVFRMVDVGILDEDSRVELIEGELIEMPPIGAPHAGAVNMLTRSFVLGSRDQAVVSIQNGLRLSDLSLPQPDVVVLKPHASSYSTRLPTTKDVLLLVEVAHSTLNYDRNRKLPLYARHGIPEVWIVDIAGQRVTRYSQPSEAGYAQEELLGVNATPLLLPDCLIPLAELFAH